MVFNTQSRHGLITWMDWGATILGKLHIVTRQRKGFHVVGETRFVAPTGFYHGEDGNFQVVLTSGGSEVRELTILRT